MANGQTVTSAAKDAKDQLEKAIETAYGLMRTDVFEWARTASVWGDRKNTDAVLTFRLTLEAVKQVFGENNMTENVIIKAIEAGSFIGYRSIMGEAAQAARRY